MTVSSRATERSWRRPVFFAISAAVVVGVVVTANEVMLPFVLALLIAYVLTPVVAWAERRRVHRAVAILLVYLVMLGGSGLFVRLAAPRLGAELVGLRRDIPRMANEVRDTWIPALTSKLRETGFLPPAPPPSPIEDAPAIVVRPQPDGSYAIDVGTGVEVVT